MGCVRIIACIRRQLRLQRCGRHRKRRLDAGSSQIGVAQGTVLFNERPFPTPLGDALLVKVWTMQRFFRMQAETLKAEAALFQAPPVRLNVSLGLAFSGCQVGLCYVHRMLGDGLVPHATLSASSKP